MTAFIPNSECPKTPDHAVLVESYGTENCTDYWLMKNSWGIKGDLKMAKNGSNKCGLAKFASYPVV